MRVNKDFLHLINRIEEGHLYTQQECEFLLSFPETSLEAAITRGVADRLSREKFGNKGLIFGQIGVEVAPCAGRCRFCSFSDEFTTFVPHSLSDEELMQKADNFCSSGELSALALMVLHNTSFERTLSVISKVRERIPASTQIMINMGDFSLSQADELKAAGADGSYHVWRLGEGTDTIFSKEQRFATIENIKKSGLDLYYCCEPIGPEHTPVQMAEQILKGVEYECFQHGAMRRVFVPHSSLAHLGVISELRLAQITGVVTMAAIHSPAITSIGVHEPNKLGITSGANAIYAETGSNPRDTKSETTGSHGLTIEACKQMYRECGFEL